MAKTNKESLIIILDTGVGAEEFTKGAAECCLNIIKHKIYYHPLDLISILLLRTKQTDNVGNYEEPDQYKNISQVMPGSQIPSWNMVNEFRNSIQREKSEDGDWVDALIVAIGLITEDAIIHKAKMSKVVLFHNFNSPPSSLDEDILAKLNELDFRFIIVSDNVHYVLDSNGKLIPEFIPSTAKSNSQATNEELVSELIDSYPHTTLCNLIDAPSIVLHRELKAPWTWNTTLTIGTKIVINISGVIGIKKEDKIPHFKKKLRNSSENDIVGREKKYYSGVDEIGEQTEYDKVSGYMLGDTPLAFDPSLGQASSIDTKKGIHFIGFVPADNIPQEHFSGESTYVVFPQKGKQVSAKMIDALVRVMERTNLCILGWKVFFNGNKPKLVVLLPTQKHKIAGLSMIELSYHSQHRFWDFPKLSTKKNQPTEEQVDAVDELIAALDLSPKLEKKDCPKSFESHKDLLPFEFLPDIQQECLIEYLSNKFVNQESSGTSKFLDVPSALKPRASVAAEKIKTLFPLEIVETPNKEKIKKHLNAVSDKEDQTIGGSSNTAAVDDEIMITHVGTVTPAEDFKTLVGHIMKTIPSGMERSAKFHHYAYQMRAVISSLLFKSMIKQNEKIEKALIVYRTLTIAANSPHDYNDWMRDLRIKVIERKMFDFWRDVVVKHKLGLCMEDDPQAEEDFYCISKDAAEKTNVNEPEEEESAMDLFDMM